MIKFKVLFVLFDGLFLSLRVFLIFKIILVMWAFCMGFEMCLNKKFLSVFKSLRDE